MIDSIFNRFTSPSTMMDAELELLEREDVVHVLEDLFTGTTKNELGVPYRDLALPLRCALEVTRRLGSKAKPLESYLRRELRSGNFSAAMALGSLESLESESVADLALTLCSDNLNLSSESAAALIKTGNTDHPAVLKATQSSESATRILAWIKVRK